MTPSISFTLSFSEPQAHYVDVEINLKNFPEEYIDIVMPVWAPGSYLVREYAKNIERLVAFDTEGKTVNSHKTNKNTWRILNMGQDVNIKYHVYGFENSVRTNFIDIDHAFLSPVGTFMYVTNYLSLPATVKIELPNHWSKISTALERTAEKHVFTAPNFDILFDSPIEIGNQDTWSFVVDNIEHECAMVGVADYDKERLTRDISTIVKEENKIWGSNPNPYYLFITHNTQSNYGGLEHLSSTVLATTRFTYSQPSSYKNYLRLVAHEYFHLWHVKRLRPQALGPFDYTQENYTEGLWIMEGVTAYFDNLIIRRCGFYNEEEYLFQLAIDFNTVYNRPGFQIQSAALASYDAWIKHYRPDENSPNTSISYYNKGAMLAMAMDVKIIAATNGRKRLDDVLKTAYEQFYIIENRGFEEKEFETLAQETTGVDLSEIFRAAHETEELDYNLYLNPVGYELINNPASIDTPSLGIRILSNDGKAIVKGVDRGSGAWHGGLNVEDELIAINGIRVDGAGKTIDYILTQNKVGDLLQVLISRSGLVRELTIPLTVSGKKNYSIERKKDCDNNARKLGRIWLSTE